MSEQPEINLLKNGNFAQQGQHWKVELEGKARFEDGHCVLQAPGSITQEVAIAAEGNLRISVKMKAEKGSACTTQVLLHPSWEVRRLDIGGGTDWASQFVDFQAPAGTTKITVKLEANDGPLDQFGSYFKDVILRHI